MLGAWGGSDVCLSCGMFWLPQYLGTGREGRQKTLTWNCIQVVASKGWATGDGCYQVKE